MCRPGHHVGEDDEGRCSACTERLERADLRPLGLLLIAVSVVAVLAPLALVIWWLVG